MTTEHPVDKSDRRPRFLAGATSGGEFVNAALGKKEPSLRLRVVAAFLQFSAGFGLFGLATALLFSQSIPALRKLVLEQPLQLSVAALILGGYFVTGIQLRARKRSAGVSAALAFLIPIVERLAAGRGIHVSNIVFGGVLLALLASVWSELE